MKSDRPMLQANNLEVRRNGALALAVPELEVMDGEVLALIGPNGAGKSTLLLALALLEKPAAGEIRVAREAANDGNRLKLRRRMSVVFQEPLLLDMSVAENVASGLKLRGIDSRERRKRIAYWLDRFGIAHLAERRAKSLSGGEAQRASLARAFALEPDILFLDEPFSALDAPARTSISADLLSVLHASETTTILVTHDLDEALAFGDRVGVLIGGQVRQIGVPQEVFSAPVDPEVAAFVGVGTIVPGVVTAQDQGLALVQVCDHVAEVVSDLRAGTPVFLCLRPEDVTVQLNGAEMRTSARNRLEGVVSGLAPALGQVRVTVDCGFPVKAAVTRRSVAELELVEGMRVSVSFKATAAHLIPRSEHSVEVSSEARIA